MSAEHRGPVIPTSTRLRVALHLPENRRDLVAAYLTAEPLRPWYRLELAYGGAPTDISVVVPQLLNRVRSDHRRHRVVVMLGAAPDGDVVAAGCRTSDLGGLVLADRPLTELGGAIMTSAAGGVWIAPPLWDRIRNEVTGGIAGAQARSACEVLTSAERRTLADVAEGLSNQQIATKRQVTVRTVKFHVENLLAKTGRDNRAALVALAFQARIVNVPKDWSLDR